MRPTNCNFGAACLLCCLSYVSLSAQEQLGMRLERYSGIYGAAINPAQTAFNPNNWEVSLFTADLFFENNYAFLQNTSLQNALRNTDNIRSRADQGAEINPPANPIYQDFYDNNRPMHVIAQTRVTGPSFSFRFGENNVIGLVNSARFGFTSYKIPAVLRYYNISDLPLGETINIPSTSLNSMAWSEIGLHYSRKGGEDGNTWAAGITPRLLYGYEAVTTRARSEFDYAQQPGDTVALGRARWDYGLTTGNFTDNTDAQKLRVQGHGFAVDLGFAMTIADEEGEDNDYRFKFGASLLDLGVLHFNNTAERHTIQYDTIVRVTESQFPDRTDPKDVLLDISNAFLKDPNASLQAQFLNMGLPTALSLQADVKVQPYFYVGALLVQRIPLAGSSVYRANTLAVVPRFEHKWFSVSTPVVLNDWSSLRFGLAARLAYLNIGTDNLGSFFQKKELSGADFYVGLKITGFSLHFGKIEMGGGHQKSSSRGNSKRKVRCYDF